MFSFVAKGQVRSGGHTQGQLPQLSHNWPAAGACCSVAELPLMAARRGRRPVARHSGGNGTEPPGDPRVVFFAGGVLPFVWEGHGEGEM
jgi:hypothetical protein